MVIRPKLLHTVKDWSKELPLSTEAPLQPKPSAKGVKKTIREVTRYHQVYGTTGLLTAADLDKIDNAVPSVQSLATKATAPKVRSRPTMEEIRSLDDRLTRHQLSSARVVSGLQKELKFQSQTYEHREKE